MRKFAVFLLMVVSLLFFVSCGDEETKIITPLELDDIKPLHSFSNQYAELGIASCVAKNGNWIFHIVESATGEDEFIVRFSIDAPEDQEVVYKGDYLDHIAILEGWMYFTESHKQILYKVNIESGEKIELASKVDAYILAENAIVYSAGNYWKSGLYSMNLDGSDKKEILGRGHVLLGIDNGWLYFYLDDGEDGKNNGIPYRIKLDGTGEPQLVVDKMLDASEPFAVDKDIVYFIRRDVEEKGGSDEMVKKTKGGAEEVVYSFSGDNMASIPINMDEDYIYFGIGRAVYRADLNGQGKAELMYRVNLPIMCIMLYEGDILVGLSSGDGIYIKQDDTRIKMESLFF